MRADPNPNPINPRARRRSQRGASRCSPSSTTADGTGFSGTCAECRSLGGVLARLEALGYACYWQGAHGGVARASGRCCLLAGRLRRSSSFRVPS